MPSFGSRAHVLRYPFFAVCSFCSQLLGVQIGERKSPPGSMAPESCSRVIPVVFQASTLPVWRREEPVQQLQSDPAPHSTLMCIAARCQEGCRVSGSCTVV